MAAIETISKYCVLRPQTILHIIVISYLKIQQRWCIWVSRDGIYNFTQQHHFILCYKRQALNLYYITFHCTAFHTLPSRNLKLAWLAMQGAYDVRHTQQIVITNTLSLPYLLVSQDMQQSSVYVACALTTQKSKNVLFIYSTKINA